jgi:hypothetical protein
MAEMSSWAKSGSLEKSAVEFDGVNVSNAVMATAMHVQLHPDTATVSTEHAALLARSASSLDDVTRIDAPREEAASRIRPPRG